jgi:hypothetical protein
MAGLHSHGDTVLGHNREAFELFLVEGRIGRNGAYDSGLPGCF